MRINQVSKAERLGLEEGALGGPLGRVVSGIEAVEVSEHYKNVALQDGRSVAVRTQVLLFVT